MIAHRNMYILRWLLLVLTFWGAHVSGQDESAQLESVPTPLELYRGFIDGNGGHSNIMSLNTLVISARMKFPNGEIMEFKLYRKRPHMMRMRLNMPEFYSETVFNGTKGWRQITSNLSGESERTELTDEELKGLRSDSSIEGPFFKVGSNSANILSVEHDAVEGKSALRMEIDPKADTIYEMIWLDAETFQEVKLARPLKPTEEGEPVWEEIVLSDPDQIEGVNFSRRMDYFHNGELVKTLEVDRVRANVGIFDSYFSLK